MILDFMGVERIVGLMGVEFVVVHVVINASDLAKFAYSLKTKFVQLCLLRLGFGRQRNDVLNVMWATSGTWCLSPDA